jgi:hypothetical protein
MRSSAAAIAAGRSEAPRSAASEARPHAIRPPVKVIHIRKPTASSAAPSIAAATPPPRRLIRLRRLHHQHHLERPQRPPAPPRIARSSTPTCGSSPSPPAPTATSTCSTTTSPDRSIGSNLRPPRHQPHSRRAGRDGSSHRSTPNPAPSVSMHVVAAWLDGTYARRFVAVQQRPDSPCRNLEDTTGYPEGNGPRQTYPSRRGRTQTRLETATAL